MLLAVIAVLVSFVAALPSGAATIESYAVVRDDGTLLVQRKIIRLLGVYLPDLRQTCRTGVAPIRCGPRGALALDSMIRGFVRCEVQERYVDGSLGAFCSVDGASILAPDVDLGAWLIELGFAVATPDAPFEYHVLEDIARSRGLGVWGFQVDDFRHRRSRSR
jgi:endonuclease YncB( thermonuclease family)